ncbi:MAG: hypothetical protein ACE5I1_25905, partial [bacterium]
IFPTVLLLELLNKTIIMEMTDEQVRLIIRTVKKHLGKNATPETMKYIVKKIIQKLSDERSNQQVLP